LKNLTQVVKKLGWSIDYVSSDEVRKEVIDRMMAKEPKLTRSEAFEKTQKSGPIEFEK
jgi:hypothetical protein